MNHTRGSCARLSVFQRLLNGASTRGRHGDGLGAIRLARSRELRVAHDGESNVSGGEQEGKRGSRRC